MLVGVVDSDRSSGVQGMEMWLDHTGVDDRGVHRKRARAPTEDETPGIDLTPMLDVVMIMLIFLS